MWKKPYRSYYHAMIFFLKGDDLIFKIKNYLINIQNALAKVKIHVDIRNVRLFRPHFGSISEI